MTAPKVYILVLNYKNWEDSRDCLESVLRSTYRHYSVIVIDNNSGNGSLEHLSEWVKNEKGSLDYSLLAREQVDHSTSISALPKIVFLQNETNAGFAAANNIALRFLRDENAFVWLLNPDMLIKENTLEELVAFAAQQDKDCIIGAEVRYNTGNQDLFFYGGGKVNFWSATIQTIKEPSSTGRLDYISGGCLFTHAQNFRTLGLLPEEYFLYWEETDWCYRSKQLGYKLLVCPAAICYDKVSTVIGKGFLSDYYYARNGLMFVSKYRKRNVPVALMLMGVRYLKRIFSGQWSRARGVYKGAIDFLKMKPDEIK